MKRKSGDVEGNAFASQALYAKEMCRIGESLTQMEYTVDTLFDKEIDIVSLRVKFPDINTEGYLVVVKAYIQGTAVVGFHGDTTFVGALQGTVNRLRNGTIKWKEDSYGQEVHKQGKDTG